MTDKIDFDEKKFFPMFSDEEWDKPYVVNFRKLALEKLTSIPKSFWLFLIHHSYNSENVVKQSYTKNQPRFFNEVIAELEEIVIEFKEFKAGFDEEFSELEYKMAPLLKEQ